MQIIKYDSQVSLIFTPPKENQSPYVVIIFLLAGCLGYSNSAVNPVLYAFLSENFRKSFMKVPYNQIIANFVSITPLYGTLRKQKSASLNF